MINLEKMPMIDGHYWKDTMRKNMRTKSIVAIIAIAAISTGCSSGRWATKSGSSPSQSIASKCGSYVTQKGNDMIENTRGGNSPALAIAATVSAFFLRDKWEEKCMTENGYRWVEDDD
jgi:hypothetical protein